METFDFHDSIFLRQSRSGKCGALFMVKFGQILPIISAQI